MHIEVWCRARWWVAQVVAVSEATATATVRYVRSGRRESVGARTQPWRLLAPDSDVDAVLRDAAEQRAAAAGGAVTAAAAP